MSEPLSGRSAPAIGWKSRPGRRRRAHLLQVLPAHEGRPGALGHQRGEVLSPATAVDPGCDHSERHYASCARASREHFPGAARARVPVRLGRRRSDATTRFTPFFGHGARWARPVRPGLHRPRHRHDAPGGQDPRAHGARPAKPASRLAAGPQTAVPLPAGTAAFARSEPRLTRTPARRCRREAGPAAPGPRHDRHRPLQLSASPLEARSPRMAAATAYAGALVQGLTLVSFPASSAILKDTHDFSDAEYGAISVATRRSWPCTRPWAPGSLRARCWQGP